MDEDIIALSNEIEKLVKYHGISYMDACLAYCEKNEIEEEYIGEIIAQNQNIKSKIEKEAEQLNFLEKQTRIDLWRT